MKDNLEHIFKGQNEFVDSRGKISNYELTEPVNLIGYIERNEIKPLVSRTYPLKDIVSAQKDFLEKKYVGKLVLMP